MELYAIENLTFTYPEQTHTALVDVTLHIEQGEFVVLCGSSGSGKSTLLSHLKTVLTPHGVGSGRILFDGKNLTDIGLREQSARIGFVLQSPENQVVTDKVWHELAFGLESLGCDAETMGLRVAEMASFFGIQTWFHKNVTELSGGQKQLLNLASIMAMQPSVLILDEPTSQLDPIAASDFLATVAKINRELGTTIVLTEHRLDEVFPLADRAIVMEDGRIIADDKPNIVGETLARTQHKMFLSMPVPMRIYAGIPNELACPITVREGRTWMDDLAKLKKIGPVGIKEPRTLDDETMIQFDEAWFRYEENATDVIRGLSLAVKKGEFLAILGGNGTGKTTALSLISGIHAPYRGTVKLAGRPMDKISNSEKFGGLLGVLPQNPKALFVKKTVALDLYEALGERKLTKQEKDVQVQRVVRICKLETLLQQHPYDLSGGEQQRAALAKVLLCNPQILLLDEPTKGLDAEFKQSFARTLRGLSRAGVTIVMVSHDIEFCAQYADQCALFFDGKIVARAAPQAFFAGNGFYTTAANRMARHLMPDAITPEDVIGACGGTVPEQAQEPPNDDDWHPPIPPTRVVSTPADDARVQVPVDKRTLTKRTLWAMVMILMIMPLTIFVGVYYFGDRKYYFISMLLVLETLLPFAMIFEDRKPQARELIIIAVLCAIGVAGRGAFFMIPQFKPVVALVIIAGVAFGGETGFLVGALTAFVSNMFFGQGPWTPWQMFAFGIIGFLAGVLFRKGWLCRSRLSLSVFGGVTTFLIYGGIMDTSAVLMVQANPSASMLVSAYLMGIPFNIIHSVATIFFLYVISQPMLEKLDRIKIKYGIVE